MELGKYGLGRRDFAANVNWFSRVDAGADGSLAYREDHSPAGSSVTLRFEMPTLVVLHTCPHPLNAAAEYPRRAIGYQLILPARWPRTTPAGCRGPRTDAAS